MIFTTENWFVFLYILSSFGAVDVYLSCRSVVEVARLDYLTLAMDALNS